MTSSNDSSTKLEIKQDRVQRVRTPPSGDKKEPTRVRTPPSGDKKEPTRMRTPPSGDKKEPTALAAGNLSSKLLRGGDVDFREQSWFLGMITRQESEMLLLNNGRQGDFLIRESTNRVC